MSSPESGDDVKQFLQHVRALRASLARTADDLAELTLLAGQLEPREPPPLTVVIGADLLSELQAGDARPPRSSRPDGSRP